MCHIERDASGIGDFTEDGGAVGAGGGGEIGRAMVEGLVGEEGEGVGFLGLFRDVEVGGGDYFDGIFWKVPSGEWPFGYAQGRRAAIRRERIDSEKGFELGHEKGIAGAAAGDDQLGDFVFGKDKTAEGIYDGCGREIGHGVENVSRPYFELAGEVEEILDVVRAEIFAAGRLWRTKLEVGILHQAVDQSIVDMAATGKACVFVEALAAFGEVGDEGVDEDVGGAGVEGEDVLRLGVGRDDRDIGDAAEIEGDAADFFVAVKKVVGEGD